MSSDLMDSMGLGNIDIGYLFLGIFGLLLILIILLIVQMVKISKLKKRYEKFMRGKDGKSLEKEISGIFEDNKFLKVSSEENRKDILKLYKNMELAYQKIGLVKYDAFREMGGKLSFSLAMLNAKNDGFIMNSVHSTDGCYTYTKKITNGECSISLGEEEQEALRKAMESK